MRIHILIASAAALVACGGSTSPVSSSFADASSDVAPGHMTGHVNEQDGAASSSSSSGGSVSAHPKMIGPASGVRQGVTPLGMGGSTGNVADAGNDATASGPFACGGVMCTPPNQYCSVTRNGGGLFDAGGNTSSQCMTAPFNCSSGATCACVQPPFEGGMPGCSCEDNGGAVTITCLY